MRQSAIYAALIFGVATVGTASAASACCLGAGYGAGYGGAGYGAGYGGYGYGAGYGLGTGCGCGYAAATAYVVAPVVAPVAYPYVNGGDVYSTSYYSSGPYGNPVGYPGYYHPYGDVGYSGLPGVGPQEVQVGPEYVRARRYPTWRFSRYGGGYHRYRNGYPRPHYQYPMLPSEK